MSLCTGTRKRAFLLPFLRQAVKNGDATMSEVLSVGLEQIFEPGNILKRVDIVDGMPSPVYATIKDDKEYLYLIIGMLLTA